MGREQHAWKRACNEFVICMCGTACAASSQWHKHFPASLPPKWILNIIPRTQLFKTLN